MKLKRNGDVNLHPITKEDFDKVNGEFLKHEGRYVLARGEATGSVHEISVKEKGNMLIKIGTDGRVYFCLLKEAKITHTHDHEPIDIPSQSYYVQVQEREVDHFSNSITRKVVD